MSIKDLLEKIKSFYGLLLVLVVASIFFALGRISAVEEKRVPIKIEYSNFRQTAAVTNSISSNTDNNGEVRLPSSEASGNGGQARLPSSEAAGNDGQVIGSKNGKKYYFPWCGTVKMIKPENQVKFSSIVEARNAGYLPASNCKGLK